MVEKNSVLDDNLQSILIKLASKGNLTQPFKIGEFSGDGSIRRFFRITDTHNRSLIVILPSPKDHAGLKEARAAHRIGLHLAQANTPVPIIYDYLEESGILLCEDLGTCRLYEIVEAARDNASPFPIEIYKKTVCRLAHMQVRGAKNFDKSWCWDTPFYDRTLMMERESGYFLQALCIDYLGLRPDNSQLTSEFEKLANRAGSAPNTYFLHRDFQCRNIMVQDGIPRFIDFQGGRLGPIAYDLASLLIDPYAELTSDIQEELIHVYFHELQSLIPYDEKRFFAEYSALALQRNLQILGAFSFLSQKRGKVFFAPYILPALLSLQCRLAKVDGDDYPALRNITEKCIHKVNNECQ
ncbi:MAG: phosphotransferase [Desulfobulbaceae bacterium]|nr:phosphotransferase [Desulfobulbaceae bacterium]